MLQRLANIEQCNHWVKQHPCFNSDAHFKFGRIHLPVSLQCNIQCRFCKREMNKWENRPGVSCSLLTPEEAVETVAKALDACPELTVVGIAGPGDTLATDHALEVFEKIHARFPGLINCLSTNGLLLAEKAERIVEAGVKTVTVSVHAVADEIVEKICSHVYHNGQYLTGVHAARLLITAQLEGIRKIAALGVVVKINTVLIPGINDHHIGHVAELTAKLGASLINIIPLLPQFEFKNRKVPNCAELNAAQIAAERYLPVFRHCQHCRADAFGIPGSGKNLAGQLYDEPIYTFSHG